MTTDTTIEINSSEGMMRAVLVGLQLPQTRNFDHSMEELRALAEACHYKAAAIYTQNATSVNTAFYIGTGKVTEIKTSVENLEADCVIFDESLSPIQLRNLTDALSCTVLDRTLLILNIFGDRAKTAEAKLQVELANLQYMLPRLVGMHASLSRQGGASGSMSNKGTGEKKLELDKRHIEHRITELKKSLADVSKNRATARKQRQKSGLKKVALVGYTNAGKSTIMNWMVQSYGTQDEKTVLEKDMLFATLDTSIRKIEPENMPPFLLSDTVGFIERLPHDLVNAFHSTLEEAKYSDLILLVVDASDEYASQQIQVTLDTLKQLGASDIPRLYLYNKSELVRDPFTLPFCSNDRIYFSAKEKTGMDMLLSLIIERLYPDRKECEFLLPLCRGDILHILFDHAFIHAYEYRPDGIFCKCSCENDIIMKFEQYIVSK